VLLCQGERRKSAKPWKAVIGQNQLELTLLEGMLKIGLACHDENVTVWPLFGHLPAKQFSIIGTVFQVE
jgi:hypothetical protein